MSPDTVAEASSDTSCLLSIEKIIKLALIVTHSFLRHKQQHFTLEQTANHLPETTMCTAPRLSLTASALGQPMENVKHRSTPMLEGNR